MQVTVEKPEQGLEYKMNVTLPAGDLATKVANRLNEIRRTAKMDGFRQGKVPLGMIKKRYGQQVNSELVEDKVQTAFYDAVKQEAINIAGYPRFLSVAEKDGNIEFSVSFEAFPEVVLPAFSTLSIEKITATVSDDEVAEMIEKLRQQKAAWKPNDEKVADKGDQVIISFVGKKDGEEFAGGKADDIPLVLGSGRMIPGFEDGIIGMKKAEEKTIEVTFPADYHSEDLKGQAVTFDITVHSVQTQVLPEVDEAFVTSFGVDAGTQEALQAEIKKSMEAELARTLDNKNRTQTLDTLAEAVALELPESAVQREVSSLMQRAYENMKQQGIDPAKANLQADGFVEEAKKRVKLGVVIGEIIRANNIEATMDKIDAYLTEQSSGYEDPSQVISWYKSNPEAMDEIRAIVTEKEVTSLIIEQAKVTEVAKTFNEVVKTNN